MQKRLKVATSLVLMIGLLPTVVFAAGKNPSTTHSKSTHHAAAKGTNSASGTTAAKGTKSKGAKSTGAIEKTAHGKKLHGQQAIDPERVTQIQQALIGAHYLDGEANGDWDNRTVAAMQRMQADNNWQTKLMPDARALKKLGLGPDYSDAINAQSANFAAPVLTPAVTPETSGFVDASGVKK